MNDFWLELLGVRTGEDVRVVGGQWQWNPAIGWPALLALLAAAVAVAVLSYRRKGLGLSPGRLRLLLALRLLALLGLAGVLVRPSLGLRVEGAVRQTLALLFDASASLGLVDPRTDPPDQVRAGIALGRVPVGTPVTERPASVAELHPSRVEALRGIVTHRDLALLDRLGRSFDLHAYGFAGELVPLPLAATNSAPKTGAKTSAAPALDPAALAAALRADGRETAPGTALREVLDRERGRPLAGVVFFTDGQESPPLRNKDVTPPMGAPLCDALVPPAGADDAPPYLPPLEDLERALVEAEQIFADYLARESFATAA